MKQAIRQALGRVAVLTLGVLAVAVAADGGYIEKLRQAGATPADLVQIEEMRAASGQEKLDEQLRTATPEQLAGMLDYVRTLQHERSEHPTLAIGAALPEFSLKGVDGKTYTPASFKGSSVLVVMFISNHCPASQLYEAREKKLVETYAGKGVAFVAIQPDSVKATAPSEYGYTDVDDSFEGMAIRASYSKLPFPYLDDGDQQKAANAFGPKATPHLFIFDKEGKLRFEGRIDDNLRETKAKSHEALDAIDALLAGKTVPVQHTPVFGCSIKWKSRVEGVEREVKAWQQKPVSVETVSVEGLKKLRVTPPGHMLMINLWATWCGPCQVEYPELIKTYQWYQSRGFDFVSVSVDSPDSRSHVLKFLKKVHSPVRNLQVDTDDVYAVQKAFDPTWESGVPFTLVIDSTGKVIYRQEGELDILKLRRKILANLDDAGLFAGNTAYWRK